MLNSNKKWFFGAIIVIVAIFVSFSLMGKNQTKTFSAVYQNNDTTHYWCNYNVPMKYHLSDEQIEKIDKIKAEYDELIQPEINKLYKVNSDFSDYQQLNDVSNKKIKEYQNDIRNIEDNIESLKVEAGNKIRNILNDGQKTYYNDFVFNGWWGWDCNRYMHNGNMHNGNMNTHRNFKCNGCCGW